MADPGRSRRDRHLQTGQKSFTHDGEQDHDSCLHASQVIYQLSYPGSFFLGTLLYITVNSSCYKFIRFNLNYIRNVKQECCTNLKKYVRTNQADTGKDSKPVTDILTAICPIAILLYMQTICCQETYFDISLKTVSNILLSIWKDTCFCKKILSKNAYQLIKQSATLAIAYELPILYFYVLMCSHTCMYLQMSLTICLCMVSQ